METTMEKKHLKQLQKHENVQDSMVEGVNMRVKVVR